MRPQFREIILVGFKSGILLRGLENVLSQLDFSITHARNSLDVPAMLRQMPKVTIVVYSPAGPKAVEAVLDQVDQANRATPVVALVGHCSFGDYYSLMSLGAMQYYEIDETPEIIARGVEWAARRLSA